MESQRCPVILRLIVRAANHPESPGAWLPGATRWSHDRKRAGPGLYNQLRPEPETQFPSGCRRSRSSAAELSGRG